MDTPYENEYGKFTFIDTAGIRRKSRINDRIEQFSVLRSRLAVERSDVCILMIDAQEGVTEQDTKVAGLAHEAGKAVIIAVNKWDAVEKDNRTSIKPKSVSGASSRIWTTRRLCLSPRKPDRGWISCFRLSGTFTSRAAAVATGMLNSVLADATVRVQPPTDSKRLKIYVLTQTV